MVKKKYVELAAVMNAIGELSWAGFRIKGIPEADVVEVVRCHNCQFYQSIDNYCVKWQKYLPYREEAFCAWGKEKEEETGDAKNG